ERFADVLYYLGGFGFRLDLGLGDLDPFCIRLGRSRFRDLDGDERGRLVRWQLAHGRRGGELLGRFCAGGEIRPRRFQRRARVTLDDRRPDGVDQRQAERRGVRGGIVGVGIEGGAAARQRGAGGDDGEAAQACGGE